MKVSLFRRFLASFHLDRGTTLEPFIGITVAQNAHPLAYVRRIRERGGAPVLIRPSDHPAIALRGLEVLLLTGGADVHPSLYGQVVDSGANASSARSLDALEMPLLRTALTADIPVWGICRGFQLLNVSFGGTLIQDLPAELRVHRGRSDERGVRHHMVDILPGTLFAAALDVVGGTQVNSIHHQEPTARHLASGLRTSACATHGLVEGLESAERRWVLGVQWRPEWMWEVPRQALRIFDAFVNAARGVAARAAA